MISYGSIDVTSSESSDINGSGNGDGNRTDSTKHQRRSTRDGITLVMMIALMTLVVSLAFPFVRSTLHRQITRSKHQNGQDHSIIMMWQTASSNSTQSDEDQDEEDGQLLEVPFPYVDRADYGDPVSGILREELFAPHLRTTTTTTSSSSSLSSSAQPTFVFPFPTGAFWVNFVMPPTADRGISYPIAVYPYGYKWGPNFLQLSYPALHRREDTVSIHDYFFPDLTIGSAETETQAQRTIQRFDPLSITLRYQTDSDDDESVYFETYLVQGSPFMTVKYHQTTPSIKALSTFSDLACWEEDCQQTTNDQDGIKSVTGSSFLLTTQEGATWLLVTSFTTTMEFNTHIRTTVVQSSSAKDDDDGDIVIRLAYLSSDSSATGIDRLIQHSHIYPIGGTVGSTYHSTTTDEDDTERTATLEFAFETEAFNSDANDRDDLLMLALPHHAELISGEVQLTSTDEFDLSFECIKGVMTPVLGATWEYEEPLLDIGFVEGPGTVYDKTLIQSNADIRSMLIENLQRDVTLALPTNDENVYGYGKQSARLAQLAIIASELVNEAGEDTVLEDGLVELLNSTVSKLEESLLTLLLRENRDTLVYDANLGGLVSSDGLSNTQADFGNGRYNDHHFHYGYTLHACAVMGHLRPSFIMEYGDLVDALYMDVAFEVNVQSSNPAKVAFFPGSRHKLWFDGHSFASGLFPFGNGKSQESSSESVNCYYGAYLWSHVRNGPDAQKTNFARLLLATEIRGAKTYWQMVPPDAGGDDITDTRRSVYSASFSENYMVGNVGMMDLVCSTWFGTNKLYVHMINFIPLTAAGSALFDKSYVRLEYDNVLSKLGEIDEAWRGYVVANHAIADPDVAWQDAQDVYSPTMDSGTSKTMLLFWVMTRDGFSLGQASASGGSDDASGKGDTSTAACRNNPGCAAFNLGGNCCPSDQGNFLGCCNDQGTSDSSTTDADDDAGTSSASSCSSHPKCANLHGECCPTPSGAMLDCCS